MEKLVISNKEYSHLVIEACKEIKRQAREDGEQIDLRDAWHQAKQLVADFYEREQESK